MQLFSDYTYALTKDDIFSQTTVELISVGNWGDCEKNGLLKWVLEMKVLHLIQILKSKSSLL